jgi:hypothetical protein
VEAVSAFEVVMTVIAGGWAAVAVYLNGQRLRWKERAMRAERRP